MKHIIISSMIALFLMGCLTDRGPGITENKPDAALDTSEMPKPDLGNMDDVEGADMVTDTVEDIVEEDKTPPTVGSFRPADTSEKIDLNTEISAVFSEEMDPTTLTNESVHLSDILSDIEIGVHYDETSRKVILSPSRPLALLREYTVTLDNTITDKAGNSLEPNTWLFRIRDGKWSDVKPVEKNPSYAYSPKIVAIGEEGDFISIFHQKDGKNPIKSARYDAKTQKWGNISELGSQIPSNTLRFEHKIDVAANKKGQAASVWVRRKNISPSNWTNELWANYYDQRWGSPVKVAEYPEYINNLSIKMDDEGKAVIVWENKKDIYLAEFDGKTSSIPVSLNGHQSNLYLRSHPRIYLAGNGDRHILWVNTIRTDGEDTYELKEVFYDAKTASSSATQTLADGASNFEASINAKGEMIVNFFKNENNKSYSRVYNPEQRTWSSEIFTVNCYPDSSSRIVIDRWGNSTLVLSIVDAQDQGVYVFQLKKNDIQWGGGEIFDTVLADYVQISLGVDKVGNITYAYVEEEASEIYTRHFDIKKNQWLAREKLKNPTGGTAAEQLNLDVNPMGVVGLIYTSLAGNGDNIQSNFFE